MLIKKRIAGVLLVLFCTMNPCHAAQPKQENPVNAGADKTQTDHTNPAQVAFRTDLEQMRTVLGQMQRNVAFVSAGDNPLKHQFELEIEMWQLLLRDMEKNVDEQKPR